MTEHQPTDSSCPPQLTDSWMLGPLRVPNRVLLAPLAGIGNWFVRLQAKRYGAGMAVSEMVSSHAIHYRNERTCVEMLRIDPRERAGRARSSIQLFGEDPAVMRSAAAHVAATRQPTRSTSTWAARCRRCARRRRRGAAGRPRSRRGRGRAAVARDASWPGVSCRSRSSCAPACAPARTSGFELAHRLVERGGRGRDRVSSALGRGAPQRAARLRAGGAPGRVAAGARDPHRRPRATPPRARGVRAHRRRRGDARTRRARQPMAVRATARRPRAGSRARPAAEVLAELAGRSTAPSSTSASPARPAICASSTPGTWPGWGSTPPRRSA